MRNISLHIIIIVSIVLFMVLWSLIFSPSPQDASDIIPTKSLINQLISEALTLKEELDKKRTFKIPQKLHRFIEINDELKNIGLKYPQYSEYYRNILRHDKDITKKTFIALILKDLNDEHLPNIFIELLDNRDSRIRAMAIAWLAELKSKAAIPKLESIAKNDPDKKIKIVAINALESIKKK